MGHGGISLLEALSDTSKGAHFCGGEGEPPEGCSLDDALEHYKANPEDTAFLGEFVGQVQVQREDGKNYGYTGFIARTEKCAGNNLIFTNAHALFNRKTGETYARNAKFCLKGKCYELDLDAISKMEEQGLLGKRKFASGERYLDYIALPVKGKKPAPQRVAKLAPFKKGSYLNKGVLSAGYHIKNKKIHSVRGCKITHTHAHPYPLTLYHNCPGTNGFSGSPLISHKGEIVAFHAASGKKAKGQSYDPRNKIFNRGGGISQTLIDNLNRYCSDFLASSD